MHRAPLYTAAAARQCLDRLCASLRLGLASCCTLVLSRAQSWLQVSAAGQKLQQVPQPCQVCQQVANPFAPLALTCQVSSGLKSSPCFCQAPRGGRSCSWQRSSAWVQAAAICCKL